MERGGPAAWMDGRRSARNDDPRYITRDVPGILCLAGGIRSFRFGVITCDDRIDFPFQFRLARSAIRRAQKLRYELGCFQRPATATAGTEHPLRSLIASVPTIKPRNNGYEDRSRHCVGP